MGEIDETLMSSRLAARRRRHTPRHAARSGAAEGVRRRQAAVKEPAQAQEASSEPPRLPGIAEQLTQEDLRFLERFAAFLAEQHLTAPPAASDWSQGALQVAATSENAVVREAVSIVIGPCEGPQQASTVARQIADAPGFELLIHAFRDGYHHLDGRTDDPNALALWAARRSDVDSVELDLDVVRVVPRVQAP